MAQSKGFSLGDGMKNQNPVYISFLLAFCLWNVAFFPLSAQEVSTDTLSLPEVPVLSTRRAQPLLAQSLSVSVLRKLELQRAAGLQLAPLLNRVPGVYMHSGALNTNRITIRGIGARTLFSTNRLKAYLDDIPLTGGDGETTLEDLDLSLLGQVEVIKGPTASLYGAGLGGMINLFTEHPASTPSGLKTQWTVGSFGLLRQVHQLRLNSSRAAWLVNVNAVQQAGYRENNDYRRRSFNVMGRFYPSEKSRLSVFASYLKLKAFIPSSLDSATFADNPRAAAFNWQQVEGFEDYGKGFLGLSYRHELHQQLKLHTSLFGRFGRAYELRPFDILSESTQSLGLRGYLDYQSQDERWEVQVGGEYFLENYDWRTYQQLDRQPGDLRSDQEELRQYLNLFGQAEWRFEPRWRLSLGANFNRLTYELSDRFLADSLDQSGTYGFQPQLSPRLALHFQLKPHASFYLSLSHGFSPPSVSETLNPEGSINPDIQPETGWNLELGSRGQLLQGRLFYDLSVYYLLAQNLLVARRTSFDTYVGVNAGQSLHQGLEGQFTYQLLPPQRAIQLQAWSSFSLGAFRFVDFVDQDQDFSGNPFTGVPAQQLQAGLDFSSRMGLFGNLNWQHVSRISLRDDASLFSEPYQLTHAKLGWRGKLYPHWEVELFAGINNLFDVKHASMVLPNAGSFGGRPPRYYYPGLPRNYYLSLAVGWRGGD
jgi:iron complex outermembrane receptor protein